MNSCEWLLLKMCSWNWEKLKFIHEVFEKNKTKQVKRTSISETSSWFSFHDWFPMKISVVWWEINSSYSISRANQKKIKSSRKQYIIWTCFKLWPIKNIFQKISANESLILAYLPIYQELLLLVNFLRVSSNSKEVSYLSWQNAYPNLKTSRIKLKFFWWANPWKTSHICHCPFNFCTIVSFS